MSIRKLDDPYRYAKLSGVENPRPISSGPVVKETSTPATATHERGSWADTTAKMKQLESTLTVDQGVLSGLSDRYKTSQSSQDAAAYNARLAKYKSRLEEYNALVKDYEYYTSQEGLQERQTQAAKERDEAHQAFLNLYALESDPNSSGVKTSASEKYESAEAARKAWKDAEAEYQDAANAYYETENRGKLESLKKDSVSFKTYETAKELETDLKKVQEAAITAGATGNASADDLAYLKKKYGVDADSVFTLQETLQKQLDTLKGDLDVSGYSYDRLSGFQNREIQKGEYEAKVAEWQSFADEHPVLASAASVLVSPFQGIDFVKLIASGNTSDADPESYVPPSVYDADIVNFVNTVRGTVSEEIEANTDWELFGQNVASFLYQTGLSAAESAAQVAALGPAATYFMGASAAAGQAANVVERGGTTRQALLGGLAAGVAEGFFEKFSVERLLDPTKFSTKTVKDTLISMAAQAGTEASEESLTEISNIITDAIIMSRDSSFELSVQSYQDAGMTREEAEKQAFLDSIGQVVWAGVGGALSGVSLGGARLTYAKASETAGAYAEGAQLKQRMSDGVNTSVFAEIQKGMDAAEGSEARALAESAQKQLDSKKRVSNATLGRLVWANQANAIQDVQALQENMSNPAAQQVMSQVEQELRTSGTLSSATASQLRTVAAQEVLGAVSVEQKEAATQAAHPEADVQTSAVTAFTDTGMKLKTAQEKADIVSRLMAGEEVSNRDINKLNPTSPAMRDVFTRITGVEFPEGKLTQETLYNLYRSAKDVKTTAQVAEEAAVSDAELHGAKEILSGQLPDGVTVDTILQSAISGTESRRADNDAAAAQLLGEQLGEIDSNGAPLVNFTTFSEMYRQQINANATRQELARAYDQYRSEVKTGQFQGKRQTKAEFAETLRSAPGGAQLTDEDIDTLFRRVQDANREGEDGYDRYALTEEERLQKKLLRRVPEERREQTAAEMSRRGELDRAARYMSSVLQDLGIAPGVVVEYGDENTRLADAFVDAEGRIHFNGDKISGASMMQYILGHELTHTASRVAGGTSVADTVIESFRKLYDAGVLSGETKQWMSDVDRRLDTLLRRYRSHAQAVGDDASVIDRDYVREELAADLMRQVFVSEDLMSRLAGERPSLLMRARRTADRVRAKLTGDTDLQTIVDARDELRRLGDLFEQTLRKSEAESTYRAGQVIETADGDPVAVSEDNGDMKFSLSTYDESGREILRNWLAVAVSKGDLTQEDADSITVSLEEIYRVCRDHQKEYVPFDNWSEAKVVTDDKGRPIFSVVKANGEYAMNLDFSTVCKKRRTLDAVLNELVRSGWATENRIEETKMVEINNIIRAHGFETACDLCFVDAKRFRQDKIAADFAEMYNRAVKSMVPDGKDIPVNTFDFAGRGTEIRENGLDTLPDADLDLSGLRETRSKFGRQTVSHKIAKYLMENPGDRKLLDKGDFLSSAGFNVIAREKPGILSLFNSKKGSGGPKSTFGDVQYFNEIIRSRTFNAKKAFDVGGVRLQSFSDYVPRMVFDYAQVVSDLAAKQLPAHAYTKEELFAKQFGLTGIKINMSLIPKVVDGGVAPGLDDRGNYAWADESFDFRTAVEIQSAEGYSRNCGTIAVGISDEHIRAMMEDDRIRMIIPYHKSGLNPAVAKMNNIGSFTDYTESQNTRYADGRKIDDKKILKTIPDFNQEMRRLGDPRAAAESYVRFCESKGYLPKFDQFAYQQVGGVFVEEGGQRVVDPNYYKLLEDFTVYDDGEYVGQEAVRTVYPTAESAFGSMADLILRGLNEDAILEGRRDAEVSAIVREVQDTLGDVRGDSGARYALPDRELSFSEQVDLTLLGKFNEVMEPAKPKRRVMAESALYVAREPNSLLQEIGFGDLPIVITQQHVRQITGRREDADGRVVNEHNHQLTKDQVSRIPELLQNPAAIIRAKGRPGSAVVVTTELDYRGRPIIIPIKSNGMDLVYDGRIGPAHVITSMYGRDNFEKFFTDAVNAGDLLYVDKKRIDPMLTYSGYQSSGRWSGIDSQTILGQITPNVNTGNRRYSVSENGLDTEAAVSDTVSEVGRMENQFESQEQRIRENGETAVLYNPYSQYFKLYVNGNPVSEQNHGFDFDTQQEAQAFLEANRRYLESYDPTLDPDFMTDAEDFAETVVERNYRQYEQSKARRTSMRDILTRIANQEYRVFDLYSMAEQLGFEDYEDLAATDLAEAISESIQERIDSGDINMLEAQAPTRGLWLRPTPVAQNTNSLDLVFPETRDITGVIETETDSVEMEPRYSLLTDQATIDFLEQQDYLVTYKAMQVIDGKLYPPMSAQYRGEDGKTHWREPSQLGQWQKSDESPEQIKKFKGDHGVFTLRKGNGKTVDAAYNPYEHTSNMVLNDQFEEAYLRSNIVTVEFHIPVSELTSGYRAQYAKDAVGEHSWKAGPVARYLKDNPRMVYLTRWSKPVRILTNAEVAEKYKEILSGTNIRVPFNVVTPGLLEELRRVGVAINDEGSPMYQHYAKKKAEKAEAAQNADTRYSITPEFEKWYKETYGVDGELTDSQLQRALQRQERKTQRAEESAQAARTKAAVDAENTLTAWLIYHKKNMRRLSRDLQKKSADRVAELRREKAQALQDKELAWRIYHEAKIREQRAASQQAEKDIRKEMTQQKRDAVRTATDVERAKASVQRDADVMAFKRQAAERLRIKDGRYAELKEKTREQTRLKRKAAERALKDSRQAAKKRTELEEKNGVVKTIRDIPAERKRIDRLQERAANLKTLFRPAYAAFVNQAKAIDDFAKRQSGGVLSSTLVNVLGGSSTTIESVFKRGLVDRSGNRIGDAMKDVFLVWDGKKVDEAKQALLQDYMLHAHNVDRMSFVKNARARLEAFEAENLWLRDMDQKEFAKLVAMTETEIEATGKKKAHDLAVQYSQLLDRYNRSQDKPIFADSDGNAVTAETSRAIVEQYLAENPWLEEKAQGIYDWWDKFMRTWAVGDSLTLEQYETMREIYPHYVPTYRADKKGVGAANFVGAGGATIGTAVKKAKGGLSEVVNIEDSFANLANKIIKLARTNELYKNIIDTALLEDGADSNVADMAVFDWDSVTMGDSYKTESGEIVSVFSNGFDMSDRVDEAERPGLLKTKDGYKLSAWYDGQLLSAYISEDLYKSIARVTGSDANDFSRAFLKAGNALTGPMKTAITGVNPAFALRNISRDLPTAVVNSISGAAFVKYYGRALTEMKRNSENWQVFQALGGTHAGYYNNNKGFAGAMAQRDNILAKTGAALGRFNDITEAQTRFAEYLATIDRLGDTYENRLLGIKNAAEVTVDFSRKGWAGKYINAWVPYWNPAVQGIDKVVRSVIDSPDGSKVWKQASRTLGRAALGTVLLESILQVVLTALGRRDEWEQLDDRTKDTYYCIPLADSHSFLKIPKNREWGAILGTPFMRLLEWANGRDDPFENYLETSIIPNFLPPLPSDTIGFSQWNDLSTNEDFAGRAIVPYAYEQGSLTEQYDAETSTLAYTLGKLLKFSPMQIDYIISDYFGDWADLLKRATPVSGAKNLLSTVFSETTADKLIPLYTGEAVVDENGFVRDAADIFFGGFVADNRYSNTAVSKYYDTMDQLSRVVQDKKNHMGSEDYKETIEYQTQAAINKLYGNDITDLNTYIRGLPDGEEKDAAKEEIALLASEALDFYEQSMAGNIEAPALQAEYNEYDPSVRKALVDLDAYSTDYRFKPTGEANDVYTDPMDNTREYVLTEEQKDQFHAIYVEQYNTMVGDLINQSRYSSATGEVQAELLEDLRDDVLDQTKEEFFRWLTSTGVRSTPKAK